jgi:hypothetical protein
VGTSMTGATMFVTDVVFGPVAAILAGVVAAGTCLGLWGLLPFARRREVVPTAPAHDGAQNGRVPAPRLSG